LKARTVEKLAMVPFRAGKNAEWPDGRRNRWPL
jgi:hypothetical protein